MRKNWLAIASAAHVRRGRSEGYMQVCHGKAAPLRRIRPGDAVVYYSPTIDLVGGDRLQAFTAIGIVQEGEPYPFDMGGFRPFRRDVRWLPAQEAPIKPLLDRLDLTAGKANWGHPLRLGLLAIGGHDLDVIARAMEAIVPDPENLPSEAPQIQALLPL